MHVRENLARGKWKRTSIWYIHYRATDGTGEQVIKVGEKP